MPSFSSVRLTGTCDCSTKDKDQFMLRAVVCAHATVGLVPDAQVLEFAEDDFASRHQLAHVAPVHAYERDCTVPASADRMTERRPEKRREGVRSHLAGRERELVMLGGAKAGYGSV